jgi:hypothetical protein
VPEFRFALNITDSMGDDILTLGPIIFLGEWSIEEAMQKLALSVSPKLEHKASFACIATAYLNLPTALLNITLYLCSESPDITGGAPGIYPRYPTPKKTKHGMRLFPPPKPSVWKVGATLGEKLERADRVHQERLRTADQAERSPRRAHIRNAHRHSFRLGPKKPKPDLLDEQQVRRLVPRWLFQISVGVGENGEDA